MKVYVKKGEYQSYIPGIIITIIFLSISIGIFIFCFSYNSLMEVLKKQGFILLFAIVFFVFSLYFIHSLFKHPKGFSAKLNKKVVENYKGNKITYMTFTTFNDNTQEENFIPKTYTCYTYGDNALIENKNYLIKIKEFNWKIKAIEELNELSNNTSKLPNITLSPILIAIGFILRSA